MLSKKKLIEFPKIELHRHIEGAMRVDTLREFATKKNIREYPYKNKKSFKEAVTMGYHEPDFLYFLSKFINIWYSSLKDIERVAYEYTEDAAKENIIYIELRINPDHYAAVNNFNRSDVIDAVIKGVNKAKKLYKDIEIKYLFTLNRGKHTKKDMKDLISIALERHGDGICGIDLAGDEIHYPAKDYSDIFKKIKNTDKLGITVHAGETTDPKSIWDAINYLYATRIGHGVKSIFDDKLIKYEIENEITLELCPTSNIKTGAVNSIKNHPFKKMYDIGIMTTLNSDDPTIQSSSLTDDYFILHKYFNFNIEDFKKLNIIAIKKSFQTDDKKSKLIKKYNKAIDNFLLKL